MTQHLPAETFQIPPESLEICNCYLQLNDPRRVADELDLPLEVVQQTLARRECKQYVDNIFMDVGYNNRFLMREAMDALIKQKFQQLHEADSGSNKDIADLLQQSHKMAMDLLDREIALEKLKQASGPQKQVNVQINEGLGDSKYASLVSRLINGEGI